MKNEHVLLAQARALEPDALNEIHQVFYRPIYRYIVLRVGDVATAEDLTSEVFVRLLTALREPSAPQNTLKGWLYGVASRVVVDYYRKKGRAQEIELTDTFLAQDDGPEIRVIKKMNAEALYQAIQMLTDEQQRVIGLRFGAGLRIQEVAQIMGKSEGAIKQLQLRAVASLAREIMPEKAHDGG